MHKQDTRLPKTHKQEGVTAKSQMERQVKHFSALRKGNDKSAPAPVNGK